MARKEFKNSQFDDKNGRMRRKKVSPLTIGKIEYVDYKDTNLLNKFLSERSKIKARHNSGNDAQQQRAVARAIKNAREMALMPYKAEVTTQRRERRNESDRPDRASGPPPQPTAPPPNNEDVNNEDTNDESSEISSIEMNPEIIDSFDGTQDNQNEVLNNIDEGEES
jgi:small subunit ribosomal protein S18|tara:strand:- start:418 stop:918 length:501 start_codon:yes stop_codon:yes gene_type:complete